MLPSSGTRAARQELALSPAVPWKQGVAMLAEWLRESRVVSQEMPAQRQAVA